MTKYIAIIQARLSSSRFPSKILNKINEKTILEYVVNQCKSSQKINDVIIATTTNLVDEKIVNFCSEKNYKIFRGSEIDVLDRYYQCAKVNKVDPIIRITSDCPLIDPNVIDLVIKKFEERNYDYVSNNISFENNEWIDSHCNFPQGMTVEISTYSALEKAWKEARKPSEREHVFPYIQFNPEIFRISNVTNRQDLSHIRCTIDRKEDLEFIKEIVKRIPENTNFITINNIMAIISKEPHLIKINNHIPFDEGIKRSYLFDKKSGFN